MTRGKPHPCVSAPKRWARISARMQRRWAAQAQAARAEQLAKLQGFVLACQQATTFDMRMCLLTRAKGLGICLGGRWPEYGRRGVVDEEAKALLKIMSRLVQDVETQGVRVVVRFRHSQRIDYWTRNTGTRVHISEETYYVREDDARKLHVGGEFGAGFITAITRPNQ